MSHIIAGDPAPTNFSARDKMFHLAVSQDMVAEEGAAQLLDAHRAEVLAEAIEAVESKLLAGTSDVLVAHRAGVTDAVAAIGALLPGGESRG